MMTSFYVSRIFVDVMLGECLNYAANKMKLADGWKYKCQEYFRCDGKWLKVEIAQFFVFWSLSISSYECFILRASRLSSKLLKQEYLVERLKSSFRKFYGHYGDLIQQYEVSLSRMLNDILTLDQQWLPNQSDFPPISWPWYRLWPSLNYEWFPWSICNGCGMPAGNAYPSEHLVPSPILGLANAPIVETKFLELAMSLLDFSPRIPLGTFSILLDELITRPNFHMILLRLWSFICTILLAQENYFVIHCRCLNIACLQDKSGK